MNHITLSSAIAPLTDWATTVSPVPRVLAATHVTLTLMTCYGEHSAAQDLRVCWSPPALTEEMADVPMGLHSSLSAGE